MPIKLLSPLIHIEVVVSDAEEAYQFLNKCFGAQKTQGDMARCAGEAWMDGKQQKVLHVDMGGLVIQFVQPLVAEGNLWADFLKEKGPGVHNITFIVDDVRKAAKLMAQEGAPTLLDIAPHFNLKKTEEITGMPSEPFEAMMFGGEDKVGFRFELITPSPSLDALT